jgi:hypothetical protein
MLKRTVLAGLLLAACIGSALVTPTEARAQGGVGQPSDWGRFYYYPYVYYPENFQKPQTYDSMYYKYPANRRIPVYNKMWHNEYPSPRPYHSGHHFILDVF